MDHEFEHINPIADIDFPPAMFEEYPRPGVGGAGVLYFVLIEDAKPGVGRIYAKSGTYDESTGIISLDPTSSTFKLYQWDNILSSPKIAKAGYGGIYGIDDAGRSTFKNGACISGCSPDGTIGSSFPNGKVGDPYTHTVTGSSINNSTINVVDLPAGLTYNSSNQEISGTPTTAGDFLVVVSATSNNSCKATKVIELKIEA